MGDLRKNAFNSMSIDVYKYSGLSYQTKLWFSRFISDFRRLMIYDVLNCLHLMKHWLVNSIPLYMFWFFKSSRASGRWPRLMAWSTPSPLIITRREMVARFVPKYCPCQEAWIHFSVQWCISAFLFWLLDTLYSHDFFYEFTNGYLTGMMKIIYHLTYNFLWT